jgi:PleD family two-component response regulator
VEIEDGAHAGYIFRLTVSIGVAAADGSWPAFADLISCARTALGEAKRAGRNRVGMLTDAVAGEGDLRP